MDNNTPKYASWVPTAGGYIADGKVVSTTPQYDEQGKFRIDVDRALFAQPQTQTQTTQVAAQPTSGITTANATGSTEDANATATGIGSLGSLSENTGKTTTGTLGTNATLSPVAGNTITNPLEQAQRDYDYMVATDNIQGQINALVKIGELTGQDYSLQINELAKQRSDKIQNMSNDYSKRYNEALANGDLETANQILEEQKQWLNSVNTPTQASTPEQQYELKQQELNMNWENQYRDGINQIANTILQLTGNLLNFQYNPYADSALQIAQGYAVGRVKETMNATGMYYSSMTTSAITKAVAELVPVYEKMAKDELRQNINLLQSTANFLMNLEQSEFNMWKSQIELQWEANAEKRKEASFAIDMANARGYFNNEEAALLGVAPGTLSPNAREHLQELQEELDKENRSLLQNMVLADYKNELDMDKMARQAELDVWKYNQQQATAYNYDSLLKQQQFGYDKALKQQQFQYDLALANAKNNKSTTNTGITKDVKTALTNAGFPEETATQMQNLISGDYTYSQKEKFFKDNKLEFSGNTMVSQLGKNLATQKNDPLMESYGNQIERENLDYGNTLLLSTYVEEAVLPEINEILYGKLGNNYETTKTALDEARAVADKEAELLANTGYEQASGEIAKIYQNIIQQIEATPEFDYSKGDLLDNYTKLKQTAENEIINSIKENEKLGKDRDLIAEVVSTYLADIKQEEGDKYRDDFRTNSILALGEQAEKKLNQVGTGAYNIINSDVGKGTIEGVGILSSPPIGIGQSIYSTLKAGKNLYDTIKKK